MNAPVILVFTMAAALIRWMGFTATVLGQALKDFAVISMWTSAQPVSTLVKMARVAWIITEDIIARAKWASREFYARAS